ncbi:MAG: phosphate ABC transporter ATP-binding protein, partial [Chloroflexi bacterium]|nr:phosphate ABC transporter ATP-binding protein [Chloroflexota bacterium]
MSTPVFVLDQVEQVYGKRTVLNIPALRIEAGEVLALVGPSGAGKSTLLRLLAMLETPTRGTIYLGLDDLMTPHSSVTISERRQIAMVFQRPVLLSRNVRTNVTYGLRLRGQRNGRDQVDQMLERVALTLLANAQARTLSGGEMQRVALARALVTQPQVLLLDEPTANLDPFNVSLIENLLREQREQYHTTMILVTHNVFQARRLATRVGLILEGQLVELAPTETFFNAPQDRRTAAFV